MYYKQKNPHNLRVIVVWKRHKSKTLFLFILHAYYLIMKKKQQKRKKRVWNTIEENGNIEMVQLKHNQNIK